MTEERRHAPNLWLDLKDELGEMEIVSISLDHARQLYVLPVSEADYLYNSGGFLSPR